MENGWSTFEQGYLQNLCTTKRSNLKKNTFKVWKQNAEFFCRPGRILSWRCLKKKSKRDCREQLQNACKPAHWRYDTEDVLQLTVTRTAITYILNFAAAASILRIANRWKLQKRGYYCGSVCPGFASCTEWQQHPLELGAPARHCKYTRKKTELDNLYTL